MISAKSLDLLALVQTQEVNVQDNPQYMFSLKPNDLYQESWDNERRKFWEYELVQDYYPEPGDKCSRSSLSWRKEISGVL